MKVILTERIPKLGQEWDVITVKDGYARNYLLPQKKAKRATPDLIKRAEQIQKERVKKVQDMAKNAKAIADQLKGITLTFRKKAKEDKLYGSITETMLIDTLLKEHKVEIAKDMIVMKDPIKTTGDHQITLNLAEGVSVKVKIIVEKE